MATATATRPAKKAAAQPSDESRMQKIADSIQSTAEKLRDQVSNNVHDSGVAAKVRGVDVSLALIKMQRLVFDRSFKVLARVQKYSDKLVKKHIQGAHWMPNEGKDIVKEWSQMLNEGRADFQATVDRSYDLLKDCLERVRKEQVANGKKKPVAVSAPVHKAKPANKAKSAGKPKSVVKAKKRAPAAVATA